MKRVISLALVLIMSFSLIACGSENSNTVETNSVIEETKQPLFKDPKQEAFEISKEAYANINIASEITHRYAVDFYEAWRLGVYEQANLVEGGCSYFASELEYLTEDDVRDGIAYLALTQLEDMEWDDISQEKKDSFRNDKEETDRYFSYNRKQLFVFCIYTVKSYYLLNGKASEAQTCLDTAKDLLKKMSAEYSDYEYYPQLKDYYTAVSSFLDLLIDGAGGYTFEQIKTTISDYNNRIRDYQNDLDFIFED